MRQQRVLLVAVVGMGVLIVAGFAVLVAVIVQRGFAGPGAVANVSLREPPGTHISSVGSAGPDRVLVHLGGGGVPDRVLVVDLKTGGIAAVISLAP